ncbi:nuclear transport factor 2 family protein [Streptosporangium sp. NPDC001559]|uniref:nuclear transport factor 2 family protein n=1 Tax=Streptosporangium sp. NPDC001559 TaxID=3366187 RepID=UPI0036E41700
MNAVDRLYQGFAARDPEAILGALHPEFVGTVSAGMPLGVGGTHVGPEAMLRDCWAVVFSHLDSVPYAEEQVWPESERAVVFGYYRGAARATGRAHEAAFAHDLRLRDGLIAGLVQITDTARWAEALA